MRANLRLPFKLRPPLFRAGRPDARSLAALLSLLALLLLCWTLSGLLATLLAWRSGEPALSLAAAPAEDGASARRALLRWFAPPADAPQANPLTGLQLVAVIAGRNGVALIGGIEAAPVAVQTGKEARPGLRLVEVLADKAVFEQGGVRQELAFAQSLSATAASLLGAAAPAAAPKLQATPSAPPQAQAGTRVSRGRLAAIAQSGNLGSWDKGLAPFADGGIRVTDAREQALAQVLNLRDGDILRKVNERELQQLADISLLYHYFSQSQDVDLQILRDGKPLLLKFKIQP